MPSLERKAAGKAGLRRGELDDEAVAPAVLGVKEPLHPARQVGLAVIVNYAAYRVESTIADANLDSRMRLDVAHPVRALAALGNDVETPAALDEPDLDFTRLTADAADCSEVKEHGRGRGHFSPALERP
jgi:hypothetical protein